MSSHPVEKVSKKSATSNGRIVKVPANATVIQNEGPGAGAKLNENHGPGAGAVNSGPRAASVYVETNIGGLNFGTKKKATAATDREERTVKSASSDSANPVDVRAALGRPTFIHNYGPGAGAVENCNSGPGAGGINSGEGAASIKIKENKDGINF